MKPSLYSRGCCEYLRNNRWANFKLYQADQKGQLEVGEVIRLKIGKSPRHGPIPSVSKEAAEETLQPLGMVCQMN